MRPKWRRKKAARDRMIAAKSGEKGLIIVHTCASKGISSLALGMIMRCVAHGFPCAMMQFIKGAWDAGERPLLTGHFGELCRANWEHRRSAKEFTTRR
ncbi:cob(I)yrinic acid a,c-diamide adenosyltransferase [Bradyrhizobium lablabi]|uniref:cob(I)yrinic acid a,c-diamide adenosyltransferase n=1 Tax=Bradyrhizobium lablabi TaxID=722472 RepID=UPI000A623DB2